MGFKLLSTDYTLTMIAGDDEYIRLTVKDAAGAVIDVSTDVTVRLGIKRKVLDDVFITPEILATTYVYDVVDQTYTIEFVVDSTTTAELLNYEGKIRKKLECFYDIELHNTHLGADDRTTILAGNLILTRSIAGKVV